MQNKRSAVKQMECTSVPLGWNKFPQQKLRLNVTLFSPLVISHCLPQSLMAKDF
jgi:hypothetical protein